MRIREEQHSKTFVYKDKHCDEWLLSQAVSAKASSDAVALEWLQEHVMVLVGIFLHLLSSFSRSKIADFSMMSELLPENN